MYRADYHIHTAFSPDSETSMVSQIETAIQKGFNEIALTDHFEYDNASGKWEICLALEDYVKAIKKYQEQYQDQIKIKLGLEYGYDFPYHTQIGHMIDAYDFDFIICSTHKCNADDLYFGDFFEGKTQIQAYNDYFEYVLRTVQEYSNFDVYGHLDYVNRYGNYTNKILNFNMHEEQIREILKVLVDKGKGIEVNTSGLRYGLGHFSPQIPVLKSYLDLGGEIITIGSDAHYNEHLGYMWSEAAAMLKSVGFKHYTTFEQRKPIFNKL